MLIFAVMKYQLIDYRIEGLTECLHLFLPVILFTLSVVSVFTPYNLYDLEQSVSLQIIIDILFFAFIHIVFTFVILRYFKGSRKWIMEIGPTKVRLTVISIFLTTFTLAFFLFYYDEWAAHYPQVDYRKIVKVIIVFLITSHFVFQNMGVALLMNHDMKDTADSDLSGVFDKVSKAEKRLFYVVFALIFSGYALGALGIIKIGMSKVFICFLLLTYLPIVMILAVNWFFLNSTYRNKKILFHLRLFFYPLAPFLPFFNYSRMIFHSFEYIYIFKRMVRPRLISMSRRDKGRVVLVIVILLSGISVFFNNRVIYIASLEASPLIDRRLFDFVFFSLFWSLTFTHYYFDRHLFKFGRLENQRFLNRHLGLSRAR